MRERIGYGIGIVVGLGLLLLVAWAVIAGVREEPSVVGSFATAMSAVVAVLIARNREQRRELDESHRKQMAPIYEELFVQFTKTGDDPTEDAAQQAFFRQLHRKLLLYGPAPVLKAWLSWNRETVAAGAAAMEDATGLLQWEQVLYAIRKDLGHKDDDLGPGDLLRIYIHDSDDAVRTTLADAAAAARFKR